MSAFRKANRALPMTHTVAYQFPHSAFEVCPVPRGVAMWFDYVAEHTAAADMLSCIRLHKILDPFNAEHHTHHESQEQLIADHAAGRGAPANPVTMTSHCWFSDGNAAYRDTHGHIPAGHVLPWHMIGTDLVDRGKANDASHFVAMSTRLGVRMALPYPAGSEQHHAILLESPIPKLEELNLIAKVRS